MLDKKKVVKTKVNKELTPKQEREEMEKRNFIVFDDDLPDFLPKPLSHRIADGDHMNKNFVWDDPYNEFEIKDD